MSLKNTKEKSLKIVLAVNTLSAGGAERVMSIMANYWAEKGRKVTIITQRSMKSFYPLHSDVVHKSLNSSRNSGSLMEAANSNLKVIVKLLKYLRSNRPDVIISFTTSMNVLCIISGWFLHIPVIISERYNPFKFIPSRPWQIARRLVYPFAQYVVVQSNRSETFFLQFCRKSRVKIIYNPVNKVDSHGTPERKDKIILSVGRLNYVKGHDLLIKAFAKSAIRGWKLYIIGEGKERKELEKTVECLGLEDRVFLPGMSESIGEYYQKCSIFVLSSRAEGFPNCLVEAMSYGLPVISTDCETGPSVIIKHGEDGLLVPNKDINSLSDAMDYLTKNSTVRATLGDAARLSVEKFNVNVIMKQWEQLVQRCIDSK